MMIPPSPDAGTIHDPFEGGPLPQDAVRSVRDSPPRWLFRSPSPPVAADGRRRRRSRSLPRPRPRLPRLPCLLHRRRCGGRAAGATGSSVVSGRASSTARSREPEVPDGSGRHLREVAPREMTKDEILVGADRGLANVFVWVKAGITGSYPVPETPVVLDQKGCLYEPHVFGLQVGQPLELVNSDDHPAQRPRARGDERRLQPRHAEEGMRVTRRFDRPEVMVKVKCDVHGWMASYAGVVSHPYFAVSARDGASRSGISRPGAIRSRRGTRSSARRRFRDHRREGDEVRWLHLPGRGLRGRGSSRGQAVA